MKFDQNWPTGFKDVLLLKEWTDDNNGGGRVIDILIAHLKLAKMFNYKNKTDFLYFYCILRYLHNIKIQ